MSQLSPVLIRGIDSRLYYWCPGCGYTHALPIRGVYKGTQKDTWIWDGNAEAPTFTPSVLSHYPRRYLVFRGKKRPEYVCHSYVRAGMIQFLGDCTHDLVGQTVAMVPIPADYAIAQDEDEDDV